MPLFGARFVPATANVKHIRKLRRELSDREERLARWNREKLDRQGRLRASIRATEERKKSITSSPTENPEGEVDKELPGSGIADEEDQDLEQQQQEQQPRSRAASSVMASDTDLIIGDGTKNQMLCCAQCVVQ